MAKSTPASAGFKPIEVPVRDETARPGFKPREVEVALVTEPAPAVHILPAPKPDTETGKPGKKEA